MAECLDKDFESMVSTFEERIDKFEEKAQENAKKWLEKLKDSDNCMDEMKLRNEIMEYFVRCSEDEKFEAQPFDNIPPTTDALFTQRYLLACFKILNN